MTLAASLGVLAVDVPYWAQTTIRLIVALVLIPTAALIFGYVFLFKMMSFMQSRLGPMEAGPQGILQPLAEGIKFIQKEDIFPKGADRRVFAMAPVVVLVSTFLLFVAIPAGPDAVFADMKVGAFYVLAVSSVSVIGILMAGWASANKYSLMGGLRAAGQLIAYELPMVLAVVAIVIQAESMDMQTIVFRQSTDAIFGIEWIGNPYILTQPIAFLLFIVAVQAELAQAPFDMPIAESELVAGYMTEYSGFRFLLFFISEFATAFAFAAIAATLFLGGWALPSSWVSPTSDAMNVLGPLVLLGKIMIVAFFIFWMRFSYPRLREDQLQQFAWKVLIPISLVNIVLTGILKVAF